MTRPAATRRTAGADAELYAPPLPTSVTTATSADGSRIHVEVHDPGTPGAPPVVLIHGWTCSTRIWAPLIRALRGQARVIAYDQRGHGRSERPDSGRYSTGALADDFAAVMATVLRPGERPVIAGHSMGGMAVMAAAAGGGLGPVRGVLLASTGCADLVAGARLTSLGSLSPRAAGALHRAVLTSRGPLPFTPLTRAALARLTLGPAAGREIATVNARIISACHPRARVAWGRVLATLDLAHAATRLDVPARVVVGSHDRLTPPAHAERVARLLPRCQGLTVLPGIGHMTPLEAHTQLAGEIWSLAGPAGGAP
jgi:pimeloyl-ACP methyl ester carboxylesterase